MNAQEIRQHMIDTLTNGGEFDWVDQHQIPSIPEIEEAINGSPWEPMPEELYDQTGSDSVSELLSSTNRAFVKNHVLYCYSAEWRMWSHFRFVPIT